MEVPLIPRKVLFDNPDRAMVTLSPDGSQIAYLAPRDGVLNVWVAPRENLSSARPITQDKGRGVRFYLWAYTNRHLLYIQDKNGDENWRLYAVDLNGDKTRDLTPFEGVQAQIYGVSPRRPGEIMIGLNNRVPELHDLYHLDLTKGMLELVLQNEGFSNFTIDDEYNLRLGSRTTPDGGFETLVRTGGDWKPWTMVPPEDFLTTGFAGFDKENRCVYMKDSRGRNTSALFEVNLETREPHLLTEDLRADAADVMTHPTEKNVQAVSFVYERKQWQILDPAIQADLDFLQKVADGEVEIASRTLDDDYWIVLFLVDDGPARFYLYDRTQREARFLFSNRARLEKYPLAKMHSTVIRSRDGLDLVGYYTLPLESDTNHDGLPDRPLPMVFNPHGGPWGRDFWGFDPWHQWLANRGYAVMNVNFRSSTGFGKEFTNAGDQQWGEKIIEDQEDAVRWAIAQGIADPERVSIMGGSFGGYSTLAGLTFFPDLYACGVDIVGPSNLITLLESIPPYWKPLLELFTTRVGDFRTVEGRALLKKHSPLTYADRIRRPLLIAQGANDPRVKQAESDQIVQAMQARRIPVTYVLYPDEGHGFARPENNLSFYTIAEAFLSRVLGGRYEPTGEDLRGSSVQVLTGVEDVPGLGEALEKESHR